MAIIFPNGFDITSQEPIDARLVLTKEEMLNMKKASLPEKYFCVCKDDAKIYIYNSENEKNEETGRYRVLETEVDGKSIIEGLVSNDADNLIEVLPDGSIKVSEIDIIDEAAIRSLFEGN